MKKLLAILLAVMMVFCLAACGDKDEKKKDKKDSEKSSSYASALEESRIHIDKANARALKSLLAAEYMGADSGAWNAAQTYYLDEKGQKILTSSSGAMKYISKRYKDNGYVSGTCSDEGIVTVNCEGINENTSTVPAPTKPLPEGYDHEFTAFFNEEEATYVNRVEVMEMLDRVFSANDVKVQNVSIQRNTVSITLYGVSIEQTGTLYKSLDKEPMVKDGGVFMETANTNKDQNGNPLPNGEQVMTVTFTVELDPDCNGSKERPTPETIGENDDFTRIADYPNVNGFQAALNEILSKGADSVSISYENPVRETNCWRRTINISFQTYSKDIAEYIIRQLDAMEHGCLINEVAISLSASEKDDSVNVNLKVTVFEFEESSESP